MRGQQQDLFETDIPPWEADDEAEQFVASVVMPRVPGDAYWYSVPDRYRDAIAIGCRVRVPLGRGSRVVTGYCVGLESRSDISRRLKEIQEVVDAQPILSQTLLKLTKWMSEHYLCSWGQAIESVVPAGVRAGAGTRLVTFLSVPPEASARLPQLKLPAKQAAVMKHLMAQTAPLTPNQLAEAIGCTQAPIKALRGKGLICSENRRVNTTGADPILSKIETQLELNAAQQTALDVILNAVQKRQYETILLHGVTGSGKTEVYLQAIQTIVANGRQAIVLVPEISLTPQTEARFRSRFGRVAVLHSHQSDVERHQHWQQIASGSVSVVVGARSAIFAPTPQLGLVVIDEEHETSFKQDQAPRYHARDVAIFRARSEDVPIVLGSATPSLEAYYQARQGNYKLVEMPRRIFDRPLPAVATIDLRSEGRERYTRGAISRQLHIAMEQSLKAGGQVILLLNRRGFSTHIQCPSCGEALRCPDCDIALTHHKEGRLARCHYCDFEQRVPDQCPQCNFAGIRFSGRGTQRLEEEVRARFADYECLRMDTDSMQGRGSHERALEKFRTGEVRILLGTQMIAKGLDFPNVTLVGVINADTALHLPDFRAAERTFQLVTQVAGRTGRGDKGGSVLVQTYQPEHAAILAAVRHDYVLFADRELAERKQYGYPPYTSMIRMVVRGPAESTVQAAAETLRDLICATAESRKLKARVLGPAPAPFAKLRGNFRYSLQLQAPHGDDLNGAVEAAIAEFKSPEDVHVSVDVDPVDMM